MSSLKTIKVLLLIAALACLPASVYAVPSTGVNLNSADGAAIGSLTPAVSTIVPGVLDIWTLSGGPVTFTSTQTGTDTVTYDYQVPSANEMTAGQLYRLVVSADDNFSSSDPNVTLGSLTLTATISQTIATVPWSASATFQVLNAGPLGSPVPDLDVARSASTLTEIPATDDFNFDLTSTMVFDNVQTGDTITFNTAADDASQVDPVLVPEPSTLSLLALAAAGGALMLRLRRKPAVS